MTGKRKGPEGMGVRDSITQSEGTAADCNVGNAAKRRKAVLEDSEDDVDGMDVSEDDVDGMDVSEDDLDSEEAVAAGRSPVREASVSSQEEAVQINDTEWLCSFLPPQTDIHECYLRDHVSGTGGHFLHAIAFKDWMKGSTQYLGCHGLPGSGKTMIATTAIHHLRTLPSSSRPISPIYLYLDYSEITRPEFVTTIMLVLLGRLLQIDGTIPASVAGLRLRSRRSWPKREIIQELLLGQLSARKATADLRLVLDMSGEPSSGYDGSVQKLVHELESLDTPLMVFSRYFITFSNPNAAATIEISATDHDIEKYVQRQCCEGGWAGVLRRSIPLREEMQKGIVLNASGIFLNACLQVSLLREHQTAEDLRQALDNLPVHGINANLEEIIKGIFKSNDPMRKTLAIKTFSWLLHSKELFTVEMLQHAIATSLDVSIFEGHNIPSEEEIITSCNGLIARKTVPAFYVTCPTDHDRLPVDRTSLHARANKRPLTALTFAHHITEEFLRNRRVAASYLPKAQGEFADTCLRYIRLDGPSKMLLGYAARNWGKHARDVDETFDAQSAAEALQLPHALELVARFGIPRFYAGILMYFGLLQTLRSHLREIQDDGRQLTVLLFQAIVRMQSSKLVSMLLDAGAKVDSMDPSGWTPLVHALEYENLDIAKLLLRRGADPDLFFKVHYSHPNYITPLIRATIQRKIKAITLLLTFVTADIQLRSNDGRTALSYAVKELDAEVVVYLLKNGAKVDTRDELGHSPLSYIAPALHDRQSRTEGTRDAKILRMAKILLQEPNCDANCNYDRYPLLSHAVRLQHIELVKLLLDNGASPNRHSVASKDCGTFPLHHASRLGDADSIRLLLQRGANMNAIDGDGYTPLYLAVQSGHVDAAKLLLENNANPSPTYGEGFTAFMHAVRVGNTELVKVLLSYSGRGINIDQVDRKGRTALSYVTSPCSTSILRPFPEVPAPVRVVLTKLLLDSGSSSIDTLDYEGVTPFLRAFGQGTLTLELVTLMLEKGVKALNIQDSDGYYSTPLLGACTQSQPIELMRMLLDHGADPNVVLHNTGVTPLIQAIGAQSFDKVQLLLEHGANPDTADYGNRTALSHAAELGDAETAKLLLEKGVAVDSKSVPGKYGFNTAVRSHTPLSFAALGRKMEVARMLLEAGASQELAEPALSELGL